MPFAVPLPFVTVQVSAGLEGCVSTVTLYVLPAFNGVLKVNEVAPDATEKLFPPLFCSTNPDPVNPEIVPPIVYVVVEHATCTFVTFPFAVPLPFVTVQTCTGPEGCVSTLTLYALPGATAVENVNEVAPDATERLFPPLFCNTNPDPVRPEIVPPIVYVVVALPVPVKFKVVGLATPV